MDGQSLRNSTSVKAISIFLGIVFLLTGAAKLLGLEMMVEAFRGWGYSVAFIYLIGFLEFAGAVMVLTPRLRLYGASLLFALMIGAAFTHINAGEWMMLPGPLVMMVLTGVVAWVEREYRKPRRLEA